MIKNKKLQRGSAHVILAITFVVLLVGVLGFVGFNSFMGKSSNAGNSKLLGRDTSVKKARSFVIGKAGTYAYDKNGVCLLGSDVMIREKFDKKRLDKDQNYSVTVQNYGSTGTFDLNYQHTFKFIKEQRPYFKNVPLYKLYDMRGSGGGRIDQDKRSINKKQKYVYLKASVNYYKMVVSRIKNGTFDNATYEDPLNTMQECSKLRYNKIPVTYKTGILDEKTEIGLCKYRNRIYLDTRKMIKETPSRYLQNGFKNYDFGIETSINGKSYNPYSAVLSGSQKKGTYKLTLLRDNFYSAKVSSIKGCYALK